MNKPAALAMLLLFSPVVVSCQKGPGSGVASIVKTGACYDIKFPDNYKLAQPTFKVVAVKGDWVQVKVIANQQLIFFTALSGRLDPSGKDEQQLQKNKQQVVAEMKKDIQLQWLNLGNALSIQETSPENLAIFEEL